MSDFTRALDFVLKNEGGFVDDPDDAGGATNMGITIHVLDAWREMPVTADDVRNLDPKEAAAIYYETYWMPLGCPLIHSWPMATAIFDAGVLFGVQESMLCAQRACRTSGFNIGVDGVAGRLTVAVLNTFAQAIFVKYFVSELKQLVLMIEAKHPGDSKFDKGWQDRIEKYLLL